MTPDPLDGFTPTDEPAAPYDADGPQDDVGERDADA